MVRCFPLTPTTLVRDIRRSNAVPNADGSIVLFTASAFPDADDNDGGGDDEGKQTIVSHTHMWHVKSSSIETICDSPSAHDAVWSPDGSGDALYFLDRADGSMDLVVATWPQGMPMQYVAARLGQRMANMKTVVLPTGGLGVVATGYVKESTEERSSTETYGYEEEYNRDLRHNTIWYFSLVKRHALWRCETPPINVLNTSSCRPREIFFNAISVTVNSVPVHEMIAISATQILFIGSFCPASQHPTTSIPFLCEISSLTHTKNGYDNSLILPFAPFTADGGPARCTHVRFSSSGALAAYIEHAGTDANTAASALVVATVRDTCIPTMLCRIDQDQPEDTFVPETFAWAQDNDDAIYVLVQVHDHTELCLVNPVAATTRRIKTAVAAATLQHVVSVSNNRLFLSGSSITEASAWSMCDLSGLPCTELHVLWESNLLKGGCRYNVSDTMVDELYYSGGDEAPVHALVVKPSGFDPHKKYPCIVMLHDQVHGAWRNEWSYHINLALWAQQGYVVFCPNITGSSGYGSQHQKSAKYWPYPQVNDISAILDALDGLPYLDMSRCAIFGSGEGASLINFILRTAIVTRFCCAIMHGACLYSNNATYPVHSVPWRYIPPVLITRGKRDKSSSVCDALKLQIELNLAEASTDFVEVPGEAHWMETPGGVETWHSAVFGFLEEHAKRPHEL